jgi:hypothetical protein
MHSNQQAMISDASRLMAMLNEKELERRADRETEIRRDDERRAREEASEARARAQDLTLLNMQRAIAEMHAQPPTPAPSTPVAPPHTGGQPPLPLLSPEEEFLRGDHLANFPQGVNQPPPPAHSIEEESAGTPHHFPPE